MECMHAYSHSSHTHMHEYVYTHDIHRAMKRPSWVNHGIWPWTTAQVYMYVCFYVCMYACHSMECGHGQLPRYSCLYVCMFLHTYVCQAWDIAMDSCPGMHLCTDLFLFVLVCSISMTKSILAYSKFIFRMPTHMRLFKHFADHRFFEFLRQTTYIHT